MGTALKIKHQWIDQKERGSPKTIRLMIWLCQRKYKHIVGGLLYFIAAYFFLTSSANRKHSQAFYLAATGKKSYLNYYTQLLCFSRSLVDRVSILLGNSENFNVKPEGREQLIEEAKKGNGLILLGSHLGNFEASKLLIKAYEDLDVYIVAYYEHSQKIRSELDAINP